MRRTLLIVALGLALWFGLKDWAIRVIMSQGTAIQSAAVDYALPESWALRPDTIPAGAWETPWGVDVFLLLPPVTSPTRHGIIGPENGIVQKETQRMAALFSVALAKAGPVYAPRYRQASPAQLKRDQPNGIAAMVSDTQSAFSHYLEADNRGRAILLAVTPGAEPLLETINARILGDDQLQDRIVGTVVFSSPASRADDLLTGAPCNESVSDICRIPVAIRTRHGWLSWLSPNLPTKPVRYRILASDNMPEQLADRAKLVSAWLDANAPKPAEPLGGFETIEIAPIRRPGETNDVLNAGNAQE